MYKTEEKNLGDVLRNIMGFAFKYAFDMGDMETLIDRLLLLAEAVAMLNELGLHKELDERHKRACEKMIEEMIKL